MSKDKADKQIYSEVSPHFMSYISDWDYSTYLSIGGYGSGKSYSTAQKISLKCFEEKRKVLVMREVYDTHRESTFDLIGEILNSWGVLTNDQGLFKRSKCYVYQKASPMEYQFPNGSRIIFKGMDKVEKLKSLNGVSIVWLEEASEIKYDGYKELLGRLRTPNIKQHFILSCNPVERNNWIYTHFFKYKNEDGKEIVILDEERLYNKRTIVKKGVYYHHSTVEDNPFVPRDYVKRLEDMAQYDFDLYRVARLGRFGANGLRVLPQFEVATDAKEFRKAINDLGEQNKYYGLDFGFEVSYNALVWMSVDIETSTLYLYDELYKNHMTDDIFAQEEKMLKLKEKQIRILENRERINPIIADGAEPKAIKYYNQEGYLMKKCKKYGGSKLDGIRKVKRFKRIVCSPLCKNIISELQDLTYKKDKSGNLKYDEFNIDPHTLFAIIYGIEPITVSSAKGAFKRNSLKGA